MMEEDDILDFGEFGDLDETFEPNQADIEELERELGIFDTPKQTATSQSTAAKEDVSQLSSLVKKSSKTAVAPSSTTTTTTTTINSNGTTPLSAPCVNSDTSPPSTKQSVSSLSSDRAAAPPPLATANSASSKRTQKKSLKHDKPASLATSLLSIKKISPTTRVKNRRQKLAKQKELQQLQQEEQQQEEQVRKQEQQQQQRKQRKQKLKMKLKQNRQNQSIQLHTKPRDIPSTLSGPNHNTSIKSKGLPLSGNIQSSDGRQIHLQRKIVDTSPRSHEADLQRTMLFNRSIQQPILVGNKRARQEEMEQRISDFASLNLDTNPHQRRRLDTRANLQQQTTLVGNSFYNADRNPRQDNCRGISIRGTAALTTEPNSLLSNDDRSRYQSRPFTILGAAKKDTFSFVNRANNLPHPVPTKEKISFINHRPPPGSSARSAPVFRRLGPTSQQPRSVKTKVILSNITPSVTKSSLQSMEPGTIMETYVNRRKNTATLTFGAVESAVDFCRKHNQTVINGQEIRVNIVK